MGLVITKLQTCDSDHPPLTYKVSGMASCPQGSLTHALRNFGTSHPPLEVKLDHASNSDIAFDEQQRQARS